jgi:hypothetical protein
MKKILLFAIASLLYFSGSSQKVFKEQRIGIGYYPSYEGSHTFWLSYNFNNRKRKIVYTVQGMYGFNVTGVTRDRNFSVGIKPSVRVMRLFKKKLDIRLNTFVAYTNFRYSSYSFPKKEYPLTYKGPSLLPGLDLEVDLSQRVSIRLGANAGIFYAHVVDYIYNPSLGPSNYDRRDANGNFYILLFDFNVLYKYTKNYLPNQR